MGLEDVNNHKLFWTALPSITLKPDTGSAEDPPSNDAYQPAINTGVYSRCLVLGAGSSLIPTGLDVTRSVTILETGPEKLDLLL